MRAFRSGVPVREFDALRCLAIDAYDLVNDLPRGAARLAAWNAYVLQTYADKLLAADQTDGYVRGDTAQVAADAYTLAGRYVERAQAPPSSDPPQLPDALPHWHTPIRSRKQLVGMRETLEALRIYIAYELAGFGDDESDTSMRAALAAVDAKLETVDRLWIERPPDEIRGGIGTALTTGLDAAYALGKQLCR